MANIYVRFSDGSDSDNGSTWALAKATIGGAAAIDAAGDNIYLSSSHSEAASAAQTWAFAGTAAQPVKIISASDTAEPPTTSTPGATVGTNAGAYGIAITGSFIMRGVQVNLCLGGTNNVSITTGGQHQRFEDCGFRIGTTHIGATLLIGTGSSNITYSSTWQNCTMRFGAVAQSINLANCKFVWNGGGLHPSSAAIGNLLKAYTTTTLDVEVNDVDLSVMNAAGTLFNHQNVAIGRVTFRNCKMPTGWYGGLCPTSPITPIRVSLYNCDSLDTNYRMSIVDLGGSIDATTSTYRVGGASDGTTPISWRMACTNFAEGKYVPLYSDWIYVWNSDVGVSKTLTVESLLDSIAGLTDADLFMEVDYTGTSGSTLGTFATNRADSLATPTTHPSSSETWFHTFMSNENKQSMSMTFTPNEAGFIRVRIGLAMANANEVFICPKISLT